MPFVDRKKTYELIEKHRSRPLISYVTSARPGANAHIAADVVREFVDQIFKLPEGTTELDLLINSTGGDGLTSWRLISLIREVIGPKGKLSVLVPHYAFSAATLISLGADEIYMHPMACLGPVDPQITVTTKEGKQGFSYEDIVAFINFLEEEGGLTNESNKTKLYEQLTSEIRPSILGASKRSSGQSVTMAERLLQMHMQGPEKPKAKTIAGKLNKSFFSHGHAVSRTEALEMGLKISDLDSILDKHLWDIYEDVEDEMNMRSSFDPLALCLSDPDNAFLIDAPPTVNVPTNTPPQMVQQFWQQYLGSQVATHNCKPVDYALILAVVESTRHRSRCVSSGKVYAARKPDMDYLVGAPPLKSGWEVLDIT